MTRWIFICCAFAFSTYVFIQPANAQQVSKEQFQEIQQLAKAAEQDNAKAQYRLGVMYFKGSGVPKNVGEAVKWFRKSAKQGYVKAQYALGVVYLGNQGVPRDEVEAIKWHSLAAEQGDAKSQRKLIDHYHRKSLFGQDRPSSNVKLLKWSRLLAKQGDIKAQEELANIYEYGEGVPKNNMKAYLWYLIAEKLDDGYSYRAGLRSLAEVGKVKELAGLLTAEQIAEMKELAATCLANDYKTCD